MRKILLIIICFLLSGCVDAPIFTNQIKIEKITTSNGLIETDLFRTSDACIVKIHTNKKIKKFQLEIIHYSLRNIEEIYNGPEYVSVSLPDAANIITIHGLKITDVSGFYRTDIKIILPDETESEKGSFFTRWLIRRPIKVR